MNEVTWAMCAIFTDSSVISCHIIYNGIGVLACLTPHAHSLAMVINDLLMERSAGHFLCFMGFTSALHFVGRDYIWRIMAADGVPAKLFRLIKAYYPSTKAKVRVSWGGGESLSFEMRSGIRHGFALSPARFYYIINWILCQALQGHPGVQISTNVHVSDLDIVLLS